MIDTKKQDRGLHPYTVMGIILVAMFIVGIAACQSSEARGDEGAFGGGAQGRGGPGGGMGMPPNGPPPDAQGAGKGRGGPQPGTAPGAGFVARKGGSSAIEVEGQDLDVDLRADHSSSIAMVLHGGSTWTGSMNADRAAKAASLGIDAKSRWIVTADSFLTTLNAQLSPDGSSVVGIEGDGRSVHYDAKANPWLGGKTYALEKGGSLIPY